MWTALAFAVVGAIHLMPIAPVFVPETLSAPLRHCAQPIQRLLVLMRHRALLLALVGILCLWASWAARCGRRACWPRRSTSLASWASTRSTAIPRALAHHRHRPTWSPLPPLAFAAWTTLARGLSG
jgi:hypothetical protein